MQDKQGDTSAPMADVRRFMTVRVTVWHAFVSILLDSWVREMNAIADLVVTGAQCDMGCSNII